jgi:biopolymer transport protein ExbD
MDVLKEAQQDMPMDMTPMIDCVFLLMIFFVLVIDISQQNLEDLILPKAKYQEPDEKPPANRPIINILQNGSVFYNSAIWYDHDKDQLDYKGIANLLQFFRASPDLKLKVVPTPIGGKTVDLVDDPVLIRADKWTEWNYVGEVMKKCSDPKAGFWKLELAMSEVDKEERLLRNRGQ